MGRRALEAETSGSAYISGGYGSSRGKGMGAGGGSGGEGSARMGLALRRALLIVASASMLIVGLMYAPGCESASEGKRAEGKRTEGKRTGGESGSASAGVMSAAPVAAAASSGVDLPVVEAPAGIAKPPFKFSAEDERLLDEVQRGAFNFFWLGSHPETGFARDRTSKPLVSVAGIGFGLSALCVGVERGWITREQGYERALLVLKSLKAKPNNRKAGLFYHYLLPDGEPDMGPFEHVVSTIDSALLEAGLITVSVYFKGEVGRLADALIGEMNWAFFRMENKDPWEKGFITLGWKPDRDEDPTGAGKLLRYGWIDAGCEHRLVTFLAVCSPREEHRIDPAMYYRLRRGLGEWKGGGPFQFLPWSGALFMNIFSHCWMDYAAMGVDEPARLGVEKRARIDWWENSRRAVNMHRARAVENPLKLPTFGENAWGLTASDVKSGYAVPGLYPAPVANEGLRPEIDYPKFDPKDDWGDGTIAPYGAGSSILFEPAAALAALRHYRAVAERLDAGEAAKKGGVFLWNDPAGGGYGFADAFNEGTGWVAPDGVAIDHGPMLLAIENARSGLIWRTFHEHPVVRGGMERLKLERKGRE